MRYQCLNKQTYTSGEYAIVPVRYEDRFDIMKWRNEQLFHLRQNKILTESDQDHYFDNIIAKGFSEEKPNQILFSFLHNGKCIGYGGLVHINYIDKHAEVSFVMETSLEAEYFENNWHEFLKLLQTVAFDELKFHKIFTYAFDIRPHLYNVLLIAGFYEEARLKDHCFVENKFKDVLIHSKMSNSC